MLRRLRWAWAKRVFISPRVKVVSGAVRFAFQSHNRKVEDFPPDTEGYTRLAEYWDDYSLFGLHYGPFLRAAGSYHRQPIQTVLDLACGTGRLTRQVGRWARTVIGLDASEAMLGVARARTKRTNIRYVQGDFRAFSLPETFDAVICGSDSLNYVLYFP